MNDLLVFDKYTAKTFAAIAVICFIVYVTRLLIKKFPDQTERLGKLMVPLYFLLMLSFCGMQIAKLERDTDKITHSKGDVP